MLNKDVILRIPIDVKDVEDRHYRLQQSIEQIINELAEASDLKRFLRQEVNAILKEAHIKNVMARQFAQAVVNGFERTTGKNNNLDCDTRAILEGMMSEELLKYVERMEEVE